MAANNAYSMRVGLDIVAGATGMGAVNQLVNSLSGMAYISQTLPKKAPVWLSGVAAAAAAAAVEATAFDAAFNLIITDAAQLQYTTAQMDLALHGTQQQIDTLNPKIIQWADNSLYTTSQVHQLVEALSEKGLDVSQILDGDAQAAIMLGEAIGSDAVPAGDLLGSVMQKWHFEGLSAIRTADLLTGAFYNGIPSVSELTSALNGVGGEAAVLHIPLQDVLTVLDMLTQSGLQAYTAGTGLNYMLRGLIDPTSKQAKEMKALGINMFDAKGQFIGLKPAIEDIISTLRKSTGGNQEKMAQALGNLFNIRSGQAAMILNSMQDFSNRYNTIYSQIGNTSASKDASKLLNTLPGAWKELQTTFTSFMASAGNQFLGPITKIIQMVNKFIGGLMSANPQVARFVGLFIVFGAVIAPLVAIIAGLVLLVTLFGEAMAVPLAVFGATMVIIPALAALLAWLTGGMMDMGTFIKTLWAGVVDATAPVFSQLGDLQAAWDKLMYTLKPFQPLLQDMAEGGFLLLVSVLGILLSVVMGVLAGFSAFLTGMLNLWSGTFEMMEGIAQLFIDLFTGNWNQLGNDWYRITQGFGDAIGGLFQAVLGGIVATFWSFGSSISGFFTSLGGILGGAGKNSMKAFGEGVAKNQQLALQPIHTFTAKVNTAITTFSGTGQQTWKTMWASLIAEEKAQLANLYTGYYTMGQQVVVGFMNGINSKFGALRQVAYQIGNITTVATGNRLRISSPSRVFEYFGNMVVQGFVNGITGGQSAVRGAALSTFSLTPGMLPSGTLIGGGGVAGGGAGGTQVVNVSVGNQQLFQLVMNQLTGQMQLNGLGRAWR